MQENLGILDASPFRSDSKSCLLISALLMRHERLLSDLQPLNSYPLLSTDCLYLIRQNLSMTSFLSVTSNPPTAHPTLVCKVKMFQRFRPMFFIFIIPELGWKIEWNISTTINNIFPFWTSAPQQILQFKVNNKNTRKRSNISSKLTIKTLEQQCLCAFIVNFEHILHPFLVFMIFTLPMCLFSHYALYYSETIA